MYHPHIPRYFSQTLDQEVKEVYWHAFIANLAITLVYIFEPIYLYQLGYSVSQILFFFGSLYLYYAILVFLAAKITSRIGYKHAIFISSLLYVVYWLLVFQIDNHPVLFFIAPIFFAAQKAMFWPAYNADIAISSQHQQRGRVVGALFSLIEVVWIVGPVLGGTISYFLGFKELFITSSVLVIASNIPLFMSPEIYTRHRFHFRNFWKIFRRHFRNFFGYWGYAEDLMLMTLWPIVVFTTLTNVFGVGAVTTFASIMASIVMLYLGKLSDRVPKRELVRIAAVFYSLTWVFRFLATKIGSVMAFDALNRLGKGMVNVPMVALTYDLAGDDGPDHAVAYAVFYEFSLSVGKVITALAGIWILSATGSIAWVFVLAGTLTLFYGLLRK